MDVSIIGLIITFIVVVIVLFTASTLLGTMDNSAFDCTQLQGYVPVDLGSDGKVGMTAGSSTSGDTPAKFEGWSKTCNDAKTQQQAAFSILTIIVIVVAAAAVLVVIRRFA